MGAGSPIKLSIRRVFAAASLAVGLLFTTRAAEVASKCDLTVIRCRGHTRSLTERALPRPIPVAIRYGADSAPHRVTCRGIL